MNILEQFRIIPIDYATLQTTFVNYKSPKDKISILVKQGDLIRFKERFICCCT